MTEKFEKQTHYRRDGKQVKFEYFTARAHGGNHEVTVLGWGTYGRSSVLAGQPMKKAVGWFDSIEEAEAMYGDLNYSSKWTEPQVSVAHLPGEDDPVPGGMYPDDIGGGYNDW